MGLRLVFRLAACLGLIASAPLSAQRPILPASLGVPFLAQSELLCGGAAVAMVERWWGRRGVYAEEFQHLVRPTRGGILSNELAAATTARGWRAEQVAGNEAMVTAALRDSTPVIAMIEVGTNRFHYVVIVGWGGGRVVFHDPAKSPFASLPVAAFEARWRAADHWAMLVRPMPAVAAAAASQSTEVGPGEGAGTNSPLLERGWLHFQAGRYLEAVRSAEAQLAQAPHDSLAWQLLASSRYLLGDADGALSAWNRIDRPNVDLVTVAGGARIRFATFTNAVAIPAGSTLTRERLALARRRLGAIPAVIASTVEYGAVAGGDVEVNAAVLERPLLGPWRQLAIRGAAGVLRRDVSLVVATPLGLGEEWRGQWRWQPAHPRHAGSIALPSRIVMPGMMELEQSWEEFHFADRAPLEPVPIESRRTSRLGFTGWARSALQLTTSARYEQWSTGGNALSVGIGGAVHPWRDRVVVSLLAERAFGLQEQPSYGRAAAAVAWRSPVGFAQLRWSARAGVDLASSATPRGLWPIAGGNLGKPIPLRAHRSIVEDSLPTARSGQRIYHGGVAVDRAALAIGPVSVGVGAFADVAAIGTPGTQRKDYLDVGAGVRLGSAAAPALSLRIDVARGVLADSRWGVSIGLERAWPLRLQAMR